LAGASVGWPVKISCVARPAVPVALNVTGLPVNPVEVPVRVFVPAIVPRVHEVTVAMPSLPVVTALVGSTAPPPDVTAKVTDTPGTGLPNWSVTRTDGGVDTAVFTVADWLSPALTAIELATPAVPVAVNVTGLPARVPEVAVKVFAPAVLPRVQLPTVAIPLAFVV